MFDHAYTFLDHLLGLSKNDIYFAHMAARALFVYILGIIIIRSQRRFMQLRSVSNFFLYVLLGSMLASAILGASPFLHTLAAVIFIMFINGLLTISFFYFPHWAILIKGKDVLLVKDGQIQWPVMKQYYITKDELFQTMHDKDIEHLDQIKEAIFENDGSITIITKKL